VAPLGQILLEAELVAVVVEQTQAHTLLTELVFLVKVLMVVLVTLITAEVAEVLLLLAQTQQVQKQVMVEQDTQHQLLVHPQHMVAVAAAADLPHKALVVLVVAVMVEAHLLLAQQTQVVVAAAKERQRILEPMVVQA
jgi:hypothetical protein